MKKILNVILIIATLFLFIGCDKKSETNLVLAERSFYSMGTRIRIRLFVEEGRNVTEELHNIKELFDHYHALADADFLWDDYVNVKNINDAAGLNAVEVSDDLIEMIHYGLEYYDKTGGLFNILMGRVVDVWKDVISDGILPEEGYIETLSPYISIDNITVNGNEVFLTEGTKMDLGGIAKGYVTQRVTEYIYSQNIDHFMIDGGQSSIVVGNHPDPKTDMWGIQIVHPSGTQEKPTFARLLTSHKAIVTSSDVQQNRIINGVRYHHIISPETLLPANFMRSITLIGDDSALLDILSTALFCMSVDEAIAYVDNIEGVEVIIYTLNETIEMSEGMEDYIDWTRI